VNELLERAAAARRDRLDGTNRGRSSRPGERRCSETPGSRAAGVVRAVMELRAAGDGGSGLDFHGQATAYEAGYEMWDWAGPYTEIVSAGAGETSLQRSDLDVPLVLAHDSLRRIARTTNGSLTLAEDDTGLNVDAPGLDPEDRDVSYIAPKLRSKLVDEMSFRFSIEAGQWSPDYMEYRITRYDIHRGDVAIVGYGANPATSATLRAPAPDLTVARALLAFPDDSRWATARREHHPPTPRAAFSAARVHWPARSSRSPARRSAPGSARTTRPTPTEQERNGRDGSRGDDRARQEAAGGEARGAEGPDRRDRGHAVEG
jgi:uncharacterized protein